MSLFIYLSGLLLIGAVAWAAASPLFAASALPAEKLQSPEEARWRKQKEEALSGIREAEFDFHVGKLSGEDYHGLRARLEAQALEAMAALETPGRGDTR